MEKKLTNNGPLKELADKHSIYTPRRAGGLQQVCGSLLARVVFV
jgi:hypothetical protein